MLTGDRVSLPQRCFVFTTTRLWRSLRVGFCSRQRGGTHGSRINSGRHGERRWTIWGRRAEDRDEPVWSIDNGDSDNTAQLWRWIIWKHQHGQHSIINNDRRWTIRKRQYSTKACHWRAIRRQHNKRYYCPAGKRWWSIWEHKQPASCFYHYWGRYVRPVDAAATTGWCCCRYYCHHWRRSLWSITGKTVRWSIVSVQYFFTCYAQQQKGKKRKRPYLLTHRQRAKPSSTSSAT